MSSVFFQKIFSCKRSRCFILNEIFDDRTYCNFIVYSRNLIMMIKSLCVLALACLPNASLAFVSPATTRTLVSPLRSPKLRQPQPFLILQETPSAAALSDEQPSRLETFRKYGSQFCNLFPIWTLITAGVALKRPSTFLSIPSSTFPAQIGLLMLCMGISLTPADFKRVAQRPGAVLLAFLGCYGVMPALAVVIGKALALSPSLAAGLVLVSCINGAQA
jgi:hypothetical protein